MTPADGQFFGGSDVGSAACHIHVSPRSNAVSILNESCMCFCGWMRIGSERDSHVQICEARAGLYRKFMSSVGVAQHTGAAATTPVHRLSLLCCGPQSVTRTPMSSGSRSRRHHWRSLDRRRKGRSESAFLMVLLQTGDFPRVSYTAWSSHACR